MSIKFSYERPSLIRLSEKAVGQALPMDTCIGGTTPGGAATKNYCVDGSAAVGVTGNYCAGGNSPGSACKTGYGANPWCSVGSGGVTP